MLNKIKLFVRDNYLVILMALLVGIIYIAPSIIFILSLGDSYRGIPMMQTDNEDTYLGRIHEILDGYPTVGSFSFFEYKNQPPLSPPGGEFFYALPSLMLGVSLVNILIASRFILPVILFLLVYILIRRLTFNPSYFSSKLNAIAGALWVTLGYNLIDFRNVFNFLTGRQEILSGSFLIWSRPVNPILGGIFLFSFILFLLALWQKTKYRKTCIILAGLFLALMILSYFFSWGMALSILGVLIVVALVKKEWAIIKSFFGVLLSALIFASPYWYMSWQAGRSPWYADSVLRSGLFYTHYPLANKLIIAVLALYFILVGWSLLIKNRPFRFSLSYFKEIFESLSAWHWFSLAFILGSLLTYGQQIITGVTIWPYHFSQYSIPLAMMVMMVLLFNIIKEKSIYFWAGAVGFIITASLLCGIYIQASVYRNNFSNYAAVQPYSQIFDWLNQKPKDCVVFVRQDAKEIIRLQTMIPAFTHCNNLVSTDGMFVLMPNERLLFNYLASLHINNIKPENIDSYLAKNMSEAEDNLFSNWSGLHGAKDFPDVSDRLQEERIKKFPQDYREFYAKDFKKELNRYRLDYILSVEPLAKEVIKQLAGLKLTFNKNNIFIYSF